MKSGRKYLITLLITFIFILMIIPGLSASDLSDLSFSQNPDGTADASPIDITDDSSSVDLACRDSDDSSSVDLACRDSDDSSSADASSIDITDNSSSVDVDCIDSVDLSSADAFDCMNSGGVLSSEAVGALDLDGDANQNLKILENENLLQESSSIYVNATGGSDENTGEDWNRAVQSLDKALQIASENGIIYFADGTYSLGSLNSISKNITFIGHNRDGSIFEGMAAGGLTVSDGVSFSASNLSFKNFNGAAIKSFGILSLDHVSFINNTGTNGGAISISKGTANIANSLFMDNDALKGGAVYGLGDGENIDIAIISSSFINNRAGDDGAALYLTGIGDSSSIDYSFFLNNSASEGVKTSIFSSSALQIGDFNWFGNAGNETDLDSDLFAADVASPEKWLVLNLVADNQKVFLSSSVKINCLFYDNEGLRIDGSDLPKDVKVLFKITGLEDIERTLNNGRVEFSYYPTVSGENIISAELYGVMTSISKKVFSTLDSVYVNATGGSDSNGGESFEDAVKTIDYALSILNDNGTIYLSDGTYNFGNGEVRNITKNLKFVGESQNGTIFDGNTGFGFQINYGVTFDASHMTFRNFINFDYELYGGVFEVVGTLNLLNVSFYDNSAPYSNGGAIDLADTGTGNLHVTGCYFENNRAIEGGCISSYGFKNVEIVNSTFVRNYVSSNGGAISIKNGVDYSYVYIVNGCSFIDNYCIDMSDSFGGAIYITASVASITDSIFINNSAEWGGAIGSYSNYNLNIQRNLFVNNTKASKAGAVYLYHFVNPIINYNVFLNDVASYDFNPGDNTVIPDADNSVIGFGSEDGQVSIDYNWFGHTKDDSSFNDSLISGYDIPNEYLILDYGSDLKFLNIGDLAVIGYDLTRTQSGNSIDANMLPDFKMPLESFNGKTDVNELSFVNGHAQVAFNATDSGNAYVIADLYDKNIRTDFTVNEASNFTFSIADMVYGDKELLISVSRNATGNITITLNDVNHTAAIDNGQAVISIPPLNAGRYSVLISYGGNGEYASFINEASFTVKDKYDLIVNNLDAFYKYGTSLTATVYKNGKALSNAKVTYAVGSKNYPYNTNAFGQARFVVTNLKPGSYNIKVSYGTLTKTVKVKVKKTSVKYTKLPKNVKKGKYLKFKVLTKNNLVVKKQKVSIKIGKKTYKVKTNSQGFVKLKINLSPKMYKVVIKMLSNPYYTASQKTVKLRIKK